MNARRFLSLFLLLVLMTGSAAAVWSQSSAPGVPNVTYQGQDGSRLVGYLATPPGNGPFPAVIMIHEWWGLTQNIVAMADRLAAKGFVVLAADAYRSRVATTVSQARELSAADHFPQIAHDLDAAYAYLRSRPNVDQGRMAGLGFCFGGRQALFLGTRQPSLKATVILYGSGLIDDERQAGFLGKSGPVLGIFGADDPSIPESQRAVFRKILEKKQVDYTELVYPGVGHAFVKDSTVDTAGPAHDAWQKVVDFLQTHLGSS